MTLTYRERKKILSDIEGLYSDFDNEKSYRARKKILAQIEELYLVFDGKKSATKNNDRNDTVIAFLNQHNIDYYRDGNNLLGGHIQKPIIKTFENIINSDTPLSDKIAEIQHKLNDTAESNRTIQKIRNWFHQRAKENKDWRVEDYVESRLFGYEGKTPPYAKNLLQYVAKTKKPSISDIKAIVNNVKVVKLEEVNELANLDKAQSVLEELDVKNKILTIRKHTQNRELELGAWNGIVYADSNMIAISYSNSNYETKEKEKEFDGKNDDEKIKKITTYLYSRLKNLSDKYNLEDLIFKEAKSTINLFYKGKIINADLVFSKNTTPSSSAEFFNIDHRTNYMLSTVVEHPNFFKVIKIQGSFNPNKDELLDSIKRTIDSKKFIDIDSDTRFYVQGRQKDAFFKRVKESSSYEDYISLPSNLLKLETMNETMNLKMSTREIYENVKSSLSSDNNEAIEALENLKALLLNPNATKEDYKALLPDVEYIEEHEEEVEETDLYKEVIELLDNGLISMDSISLFDAVEE